MIETTRGNILETDALALVNPVNCEGVMGKGLAAQFKHVYPRMFEFYRGYCQAGMLEPGSTYVYSGYEISPKVIINVATKSRWRHPSHLHWVTRGAANIARVVVSRRIKSVAIPALGCGLGELAWVDVEDVLRRELRHVAPFTRILLYAPQEEAALV